MIDDQSVSSCPICKSSDVRFARPLFDGYNLLACVSCGGQFCSPFVVPSSGFYAGALDNASKSRHSGPTSWYPTHPARQSDVFAKGKKGRLLDVGCGNGAFAEFASSAGYEVIGLDVDATSIEIAQSRNIPEASFYCITLEEFSRSKSGLGQFDVITMFEVFEHLPNPAATLSLVKSLLRDKGLFVGSLPNVERPLMWQVHMDYEMPPYHLTYWTTRSWSEFLSQHFRFDVQRCEASIYYGYVSDILMERFKSRLIQNTIARYLYPVEFKIEKHYSLGASFYFEAISRGESGARGEVTSI
jgi:SAM-dependent methyltransferase